ncbi:MAG TPA: serine/threonine-protein kinase [Streptosporangiaceae bacterium]|nr:serine/threonine-protein kinase [Streptosporangiaceae bacterium]
MNGQLLDGRYRLTSRIAAGGMGEVWRGTDELLGRGVAVKLLSRAYQADEQFRARFRAEARYAASLSHQGIARVYDYGEIPGTGGGAGEPYLVMELVDGEPLSAIIAREGPLDPGRTLDIVGQAASALQAAHEAGIVHRDIKPGNLLVTPDGQVKITDFGIARALEGSQTSHLTQTGTVMGTAAYISPEQASGGTITGASDIYSLGVVAYECLAGHPPFGGETPVAIAVAHMHQPVPPLPASVPGSVAALVMAMLAKNPADRPGSAQVVAGEAHLLNGTAQESGDEAGPGGAGPAPTRLDSSGAGFAPTRQDYGVPATQGERLYGDTPTSPERGGGSRRRHRGLVAAGTGVALACLAGVIAAFMLPGHHTAPPSTPASTPAPPSSSPSGASPAPSSPSTVQIPASPATGGHNPPGEDHTPSKRPQPGANSPGPGKGHGHTASPAPTTPPASTSPPASPPRTSPSPTTSSASPKQGEPAAGGKSPASVTNAIGPVAGP